MLSVACYATLTALAEQQVARQSQAIPAFLMTSSSCRSAAIPLMLVPLQSSLALPCGYLAAAAWIGTKCSAQQLSAMSAIF